MGQPRPQAPRLARFGAAVDSTRAAQIADRHASYVAALGVPGAGVSHTAEPAAVPSVSVRAIPYMVP